MAKPNESQWYYLSGTIYYITAIVVALGAFLFKCCPAETPTVLNPPVSTPTDPLPTAMQDSCKNVEEALNQWVNQATSLSSAMQLLSPETRAQRQLADDSIMEEGLLSDYLQRLRIHPKPLHIQTCQWDTANQHIKILIFKD
ncbi:MAG: hypothetical protein RL329_3219 [Bacteroidota bacterium]|jgi:hypothetical protein